MHRIFQAKRSAQRNNFNEKTADPSVLTESAVFILPKILFCDLGEEEDVTLVVSFCLNPDYVATSEMNSEFDRDIPDTSQATDTESDNNA